MLRMYQLAGNSAQENKWRARLSSEGRRQDIRRLQLNELFLNGLDKLLPFVGMWKPLKASQIERMLALKSPEVRKLSNVSRLAYRFHQLIYRYLRRIHESWSRSFEGQTASCVDFSSVQVVEGLMPQSSLVDRKRIAELVDSGQIFHSTHSLKTHYFLTDQQKHYVVYAHRGLRGALNGPCCVSGRWSGLKDHSKFRDPSITLQPYNGTQIHFQFV
jgi:hypothetical protein